MWASTVKKTDAKNQATSGFLRRCSAAGAGSSFDTCSWLRGRRVAAHSSKAFMAATIHGKARTPSRSSTRPKTATEAMNPTEPHTRTRP